MRYLFRLANLNENEFPDDWFWIVGHTFRFAAPSTQIERHKNKENHWITIGTQYDLETVGEALRRLQGKQNGHKPNQNNKSERARTTRPTTLKRAQTKPKRKA